MTQANAIAPPNVDPEEMGFAMSLFVAAAHGKVSPPSATTSGVYLSRSSASDPLLEGARSVLLNDEERFGDEVPLTRAVAVLWHHYAGDERRQEICARLVAFYSLMLRSHGELLAPWIKREEEGSGSILLNSAIVEAVATGRLDPNGQFVDLEFEMLVQSLADGDGSLSSVSGTVCRIGSLSSSRSTSIPVTDMVKELATHLLAFQASIAVLPDSDGTPKFSALHRLCKGFAAVGGGRSVQPMLSRALLAQCSDFPWLCVARVGSNGTVEGLDELDSAPSAREAARGELAVIGSMVELLRSLIGDAVTLQLLRTIWPLASFSGTTLAGDPSL